jgi:transcriptional regulator with XRE-family HTH domain
VSKKSDQLLVEFGNALRIYRSAKNFSQEELALVSGLDRTYISGLERGMRNPTLKVIAKISSSLGISSSKLLEGVPLDHGK